MKINKVNIENFKNHDSSELELSKVNVIIGGNGEGKSGIIDAIGLCIGKQLKKPVSDYIKNGKDESKCEIEVLIDGKTKNTRKIIKSSGTCTGELMSTNALLKQIGTNVETARTLTDSWFFVNDADEKTKRSVLSSTLIPILDKENILSAIAKHITEDKKTMHENFINQNFEKASDAKKTQLEMLYKIAFDDRRSKKKEIESVRLKIKDLESKISVYKKSDIDIDSEAVKRTSDHAKLQKSLEYEKKDLDEYDRNIKNYDTKVKELKQSESELTESLKSSTSKEELDALIEKENVLSSQIRGIDANLKLLNNANSDDVKCPYFDSCRYDNVINDIEEAKNNLKKNKSDKQKKLKKTSELKDLQQQQQDASTKLEEIQNLLSLADQKMNTMNTTLNDKRVKVSEIEKQMKDLEDKGIIKNEGMDIMNNQQEYAKNKAGLEVFNDLLSKHNDELAFLEEAVSIYGNKAIYTSLLSHNKDIFIAKLKEIIELLIPKYTVNISNEMDIKFSDISIHTLSESEKFRVGIGIQSALAISSGIGVVIIDGSDIISNPKDFIEFINRLGVIEEIETLIVASSRDFTVAKEDRNKIEVTAALFRVIDGKVTKEPDLHGKLSW